MPETLRLDYAHVTAIVTPKTVGITGNVTLVTPISCGYSESDLSEYEAGCGNLEELAKSCHEQELDYLLRRGFSLDTLQKHMKDGIQLSEIAEAEHRAEQPGESSALYRLPTFDAAIIAHVYVTYYDIMCHNTFALIGSALLHATGAHADMNNLDQPLLTPMSLAVCICYTSPLFAAHPEGCQLYAIQTALP